MFLLGRESDDRVKCFSDTFLFIYKINVQSHVSLNNAAVNQQATMCLLTVQHSFPTSIITKKKKKRSLSGLPSACSDCVHGFSIPVFLMLLFHRHPSVYKIITSTTLPTRASNLPLFYPLSTEEKLPHKPILLFRYITPNLSQETKGPG